jgi:hypothetical protein
VLQKDAARLVESVRATSAAEREAARAAAFQGWSDGVVRQQVDWAEQLQKALYQYGNDNNINLTADVEQAIDGLKRDIAANPNKYAALRRAAPDDWDGNLTQDTFAVAASDATFGYARIAKRAKHEGYVEAMRGAETGEQNMAKFGSDTKVWDVGQTYQTLMEQASRTLRDPKATQADKTYALDRLASGLTAAAATPGLDPGSADALLADAARARGEEQGESVPGFGSVRFGTAWGLTEGLAAQSFAWHERQNNIKTNPEQWTYAPTNEDGTYDESGRGPLGVVARSDIPEPAFTVAVPGLNGQALSATLGSNTIYVQDPNNPRGKPIPVGSVLRYRKGDREVTLYGYVDDRGLPRWGEQNPLIATMDWELDAKTLDIIVKPGISQSVTAAKAAVDAATRALNEAIVQRGDTTIEDKEADAYIASLRSDINVQNANLNLVKGGAIGAFNPMSVFQPSKRSLGIGDMTSIAASVRAGGLDENYDQMNSLVSQPGFQEDFQNAMTNALTGARIRHGADGAFIANEWKALTTVKTPGDQGELEFSRAGRFIRPQDRSDLGYPGATVQVTAAKEAPTMGFRASTLKLPTLPAAFGGPAGYSAQRNIDLPQTLPAPVPKTTTTVTPMTSQTVTPTVTVSPTIAPTVKPSVAPAPTVQPPSYRPPVGYNDDRRL